MFTLPEIQKATREGLELLFEARTKEQSDVELTQRVFVLAQMAYTTEQSAENSYALGMAYSRRGKDYAAFPYLNQAVLKDPHNGDYHADWAMNLLGLNMPYMAEQLVIRAKQLDRQNAQYDYALGCVFEHQKKWEEATRAYTRAKIKLELLEHPRREDLRFLRCTTESLPRIEQKRQVVKQALKEKADFYFREYLASGSPFAGAPKMIWGM